MVAAEGATFFTVFFVLADEVLPVVILEEDGLAIAAVDFLFDGVDFLAADDFGLAVVDRLAAEVLAVVAVDLLAAGFAVLLVDRLGAAAFEAVVRLAAVGLAVLAVDRLAVVTLVAVDFLLADGFVKAAVERLGVAAFEVAIVDILLDEEVPVLFFITFSHNKIVNEIKSYIRYVNLAIANLLCKP